MKAPRDRDNELLIIGAYYRGYNKGLYKLIDCESLKHDNRSIVMKVVSGRGVAIRKPQTRTMSNGWLRKVKYSY